MNGVVFQFLLNLIIQEIVMKNKQVVTIRKNKRHINERTVYFTMKERNYYLNWLQCANLFGELDCAATVCTGGQRIRGERTKKTNTLVYYACKTQNNYMNERSLGMTS